MFAVSDSLGSAALPDMLAQQPLRDVGDHFPANASIRNR
jgi:hypothetical protein